MSSFAPSTALATQQHLSLPLHTSFLSSHALHWPCSQGSQPKTFVLFIPGNPGLVNYYIPYLTGIYNAQGLRGKVEILAVGHRGHSRVPMGGGGGSQGGISLEDQTRQKVDVVRAIRSVYPKAKSSGLNGRGGTAAEETGEQDVKLVLIGHSVGAYISLKVMEQLGDQIDGAQLLFPTVMDIARTPKGSSLPLTLVTSPLVQGLVLPLPIWLLSLLPAAFLVTLLQFFTGMSTTDGSSLGLMTTLDFITTPGALLCAAKMASDEFKTIRSMGDDMKRAVQELTQNGGTVRAYWSKGDEDDWAPSNSRRALEAELGLKRVGLPPKLALPETSTAYPSGQRRGSAGGLGSRTLQIGSTLTRAAGRRIVGGVGAVSSAVPGHGVVRRYRGHQSRVSASNSSWRQEANPLEDIFATSTNGQSSTTPSGSVTSPTRERRRMIPLTPSSPSPMNRGGRPTMPTTPTPSYSFGQCTGWGADALASVRTPADEEITRRRRMSISRAKARRSMDGSITLELPKGEDWSFLAAAGAVPSPNALEILPSPADEKAAMAANANLKVIEDNDDEGTDVEEVMTDIEPSRAQRRVRGSSMGHQNGKDGSDSDEDEDDDEQQQHRSATEATTTAAAAAAPAAPTDLASTKPRGGQATSTVCKIGMPHAFCLRYGAEMARISAYWIEKDFL